MSGFKSSNDNDEHRHMSLTQPYITELFSNIKSLSEICIEEGIIESEFPYKLSHAIVSSVSPLLREMIYTTTQVLCCPAHGDMDLITTGTPKHTHLLDDVLKIKGKSKYCCRNCTRSSILQDMKFFHCSICNYIRCVFCGINTTVYSKELETLIALKPIVPGVVMSGGRILFHEIVCCCREQSSVQQLCSLLSEQGNRSDAYGDLPIHWAMYSRVRLPIAQSLVNMYPQGIKIKNQSGKLPLHISIMRCNNDVALYLIDQWPEGCAVADTAGWLPIHYAVGVIDSTYTANSTPRYKSAAAVLDCPHEEVVSRCLEAFPHGAEQPNLQGYFPLQLYLRTQRQLNMKIVSLLLKAFPFCAFVCVGEQQELLLHMAVNQSPPHLPLIRALIKLNPEGCIQASKQTSWAEAVTPYQIAYQNAMDTASKHVLGDAFAIRESNVPQWWELVRMMLVPNRRYNPALLRTLNWNSRKLIICCLNRFLLEHQLDEDVAVPTISAACDSKSFSGFMQLLRARESCWRIIISYL